jgi:DNA-binding MarR family transcriptional regulator
VNKGGVVPESIFLEQGHALRDLKALEVIAESPSISQRDLARHLGIALGLTNACVSKMARTGLIRISRIDGRSLAYHLTPAGFSAKARLSMEYARATIGLYSTARQAVTERLGALASKGVTRIGLLGAGDVAEIVGIVCAHQGMSIGCVADDRPEWLGTRFMGLPVVSSEALADYGCQAVIVTYLEDGEYWVQHAQRLVGKDTPVVRAI